MLKQTLLLIFSVLSIGLNAQLNGIYTIGGISPTYATINAAVSDLIAQGVNGPVTFNIRDGIYNEQVTIPAITGASSTNTILIQGESQDSTLVTWQYNSTVLAENFVCKLDGAQHIELRHMTIARNISTSAGCRTVIFQNGAHNNKLTHCQLLGKSATGSAEHEVVYSPNTIDTNNYIGHNRMIGGKHPIYFQGTNSTTCEPGTVFEYNETAGGLYGPYFFYVDNLVFHQNTADASIDIMYFDGKLRFTNNVINSTVDIQYHQTTVSDSVIAYGNIVTPPLNNAAIYFRSCPNLFVYHNTFYGQINANISTSGVLRIHSSNARVANNIIHNSTGGGYIVFLEYSSTIVSDYNIFYGTYRFNIKNGTIYANLAAWQTGTLQDVHSYHTTTNFVNPPTNLHITADPFANGNGFDLGVMPDLDGDIRPSNPDIGADEFQNPPNDAGITAMDNMNGYMCAGTHPMYVDVTNFGEDSLYNVNIGWSVNGIPQTPMDWTGALATDSVSHSVYIGDYTFVPTGTYDIQVWTYEPNGFADTVNYNDTLTPATVYTMLEGAYTVGGASPDFPTLNACYQAMILRGVCGPVTFNIRTGDYHETINYDLDVVEGLSFVNTVTFQSEALSPDSVTQWYEASASSHNWILQGAYWKHVYFKHITLTRTGIGSYNEIAVFNHSKDLKFIDCIFNSSPNSYSATGLRFNWGSIAEIDSCRFNRMSEGIYAELDSNYTVTNSIFDNCSSRSIHIYNCEDSVIIRNNLIFNDTITNPTNYAMSGSGIALAFCNNLIEVDKNVIFGRFVEGIAITCLYDSVQPAVFTNNFISVYGSSWNGAHGIYLDGGYNTIFKHNSIRIEDPSWDPVTPNYMAAFGFGANSRKNLTFTNNVIQCAGNAGAFRLEAAWPSRFVEFDHNNIYFEDPTSTNFMLIGATWPDIWNSNSAYYNPIFNSFEDLHVISPKMALGIAEWAGVMDDVDGDLREHPTVGADEGEFIPINTGGIMLDVVNACDSADIFIKVFNYGLDTIVKFDIEHAINGVSIPAVQWTGTLDPGDTTDWIFVSRFEQIDMQSYTITANTHLPNDSIDFIPTNDSVQVVYIGTNPELDLGNYGTICFPDSLAISYVQNSLYSNLSWNTGQHSDTIYVQNPGTYTLSALNEFGCPKMDSTIIMAGGFQTPSLTTDSSYIYSSENAGTNVWYHNIAVIGGSTADSAQIMGMGDYYLINTDTLGCSVNSDTITIGNLRDAGSINIYPTHTCDSTFITADIKNYGDLLLQSVDVTLLVDGNPINTVFWTGAIASGDTIFGIQLGGFPTNYGTSTSIEVFTSNPNGAFDFAENNDTTNSTQVLVQPVLEIGDTITICNEGSALVEISDSTNYTDILWNTAEVTGAITIQNAGQYWVEAADVFGCMHFDTITLIVGGQTSPTITNVNDTLHCSPSGGIQWYLDGNPIQGETSDTLVPKDDGVYSVVYTDEYGCVTTSETITLFLAIEELTENTFSLYPVPANESITITTEEAIRTDVFITDLNGRIVIQHETAEKSVSLTIDVSTLASGSYLCHVNGFSRRFVIVRE